MVHNNFKGLSLSALGLGCMRFPVIDGDNSKIDMEKAQEIVDLAYSGGINYFDTAWPYHSGNSEIAMGKFLAKYPRDSYYLATKFPGYDPSSFENAKNIFEKQLEKTGAGYFDFYLMHNVYESNVDNYLDPGLGLMDYLIEMKKAGKIRHIGFSTHGKYETVKRFLDGYGDKLEFCQIQLNFIDWNYQNAKALVELLNERNIPIWVMEPLRGGKLASLNEEDVSKLKSLRPDEKIPAWAFRFLETVPGVTMVLSGMSTIEQVKDNLCTFSKKAPLTPEERELILEIGNKMTNKYPCTSCKYCTDGCPSSINIPEMIRLYNLYSFNKREKDLIGSIEKVNEGCRPSDCISCGACASVCPQGINIPEVMECIARITSEIK